MCVFVYVYVCVCVCVLTEGAHDDVGVFECADKGQVALSRREEVEEKPVEGL